MAAAPSVHPHGLREHKKQLTRRRILSAARSLFAEQGFEQTTVAQVAAAAEVSRNTCFNYFPEKWKIVSALANELEIGFAQIIRHESRTEGTTAERIARIFSRSASSLLGAVDVSRALVRQSLSIPRTDAAHRLGTAHVHVPLRGLIADGVSRGELRSDLDPDALAEIVFGVFVETLRRWSVEPDYPLAERLRGAADFLAIAIAR